MEDILRLRTRILHQQILSYPFLFIARNILKSIIYIVFYDLLVHITAIKTVRNSSS